VQEALVKTRDQIILNPDDLPGSWYNVLADLPGEFPKPKDPEDGPSRLEYLSRVLLKHCLQQEVSMERWISIPSPVQDLYRQAGRPRPLYRARRLERFLGTPAKLYYKREDLSPTGSHKVNTALAQAYYAAEEGCAGVSTETGAGQWGTALAYAASLQGLKCVIFWVRSVYDWKPDRRALMQLYGGKVFASPSRETSVGRELLEKNPNNVGSLGIAVSEGLEYAEKNPGYADSSIDYRVGDDETVRLDRREARRDDRLSRWRKQFWRLHSTFRGRSCQGKEGVQVPRGPVSLRAQPLQGRVQV